MQAKEILRNYFGYDSFRLNQEEVISEIMQGNDCLVLMPTGGGKSICYQVPALALPGTAVVISPLISLMHDQVEALKANGIPAVALNSSTDMTEETIIRRRCEAGDVKLIYVSPEKLLSEIPFYSATSRFPFSPSTRLTASVNGDMISVRNIPSSDSSMSSSMAYQ